MTTQVTRTEEEEGAHALPSPVLRRTSTGPVLSFFLWLLKVRIQEYENAGSWRLQKQRPTKLSKCPIHSPRLSTLTQVRQLTTARNSKFQGTQRPLQTHRHCTHMQLIPHTCNSDLTLSPDFQEDKRYGGNFLTV